MPMAALKRTRPDETIWLVDCRPRSFVGDAMRALVLAAILLMSSSAAVLLAQGQTNPQSDDKSQKAQNPGLARSPEGGDKPGVILHSKSDKYGTYNVTDGTRGPFW